MITNKKIKISKNFAETVLDIMNTWIAGQRYYPDKTVVNAMTKLKEIFGIKYEDTILIRGINISQYLDLKSELETKSTITPTMTSTYSLQPWSNKSNKKIYSSNNRRFFYLVTANIPAKNILLSFDDRKEIYKKLTELVNAESDDDLKDVKYKKYIERTVNSYLKAVDNEQEWMIYLPTKKIKLISIKKFK